MERLMREGNVLDGRGKCALCEAEARMHCESDDAMLCWDCDARVHGANFLVARHTRALLCRTCKAPTPWKASGPRLTPSASLCSQCYFGSDCDANQGMIKEETLSTDDEEEIEEGEKGKEEENEEDGDNQVVPWGMPVAVMITPPVVSSSSSDGLSLKRTRNDLTEQSSSPGKDDEEAEPTSMPTQLLEFDIIKRVAEGEKGASESKRKRSMALTDASVSVDAGSQKKTAFSSTVVAGEPSMSCSTARQSISPPAIFIADQHRKSR